MILYSTGCPLCKTLEKKMQQAGVSFTIINDEEEMIRLGFQSVPVLYAFGKYMQFSEAMAYISEFHKAKLAAETEDISHENKHQTGQ